ncbi:K(+)-transporting ATPase subunit F [Melaminivora sp.]
MQYPWVEALSAVTALGLFVYLGYALMRPEKF